MSHGSQPELFNDELLIRRLGALGLRGVRRVESHENRSVMVSVTPRSVLRVHRGYAYAPDSVLAAIVTFVNPGSRRQRRRAAQQVILAFPVDAYVPPARRRRRRPAPPAADRSLARKLSQLHRELNLRHFQGALSRVPLRISRRMRRKLGELTLDAGSELPIEITIAHAHMQQDAWREVEHTLLHEMIHQWQAESGLPVDHGATFRRKARAVGVAPRAVRSIDRKSPKTEE